MSMFDHQQEMFRAYDGVRLSTGRPPSKILVGEGDPPARDVGVVSMTAWRALVRLALRDMHGDWPSEEELVATLTMPGWEYRDVPVIVRASG